MVLFLNTPSHTEIYTYFHTLALHDALPISDPNFEFALAITRENPERATDFARRIDSAMVAEVIARLPRMPVHVFVCGSNAFVNIAAEDRKSTRLKSSN